MTIRYWTMTYVDLEGQEYITMLATDDPNADMDRLNTISQPDATCALWESEPYGNDKDKDGRDLFRIHRRVE